MCEVLLDLFLFFLASLLFIQSRQFPKVGAEQYAGVGAGFWPGIVLFIMMLTTAACTIWALLSVRKAVQQKDTREQPIRQAPEEKADRGSGRRLLIRDLWRQFGGPSRTLVGAIVLMIYIFLLPYVGFLIATVTFLAAMMVVLGEKRWTVYVPLSLTITISAAELFAKVFFVILPRGVSIFAEFSGIFY